MKESTKTGEIVAPVSLDALNVAHTITMQYMKIKGLFYVLIGATWIAFQSPSRLAGIEWLDVLTPTLVGLIWVVPGLISVISGFTRSKAFHRLGWFFLIFIPAILGGYFFISWVIYLLPFIDAPGYERAGITTVSYWAYSASAYLMARISTLTASVVPVEKSGGRHA